MKFDFTKMTKVELRAYVVAHPNDQAAFYAFVDRFTSDASPAMSTPIASQADVEAIAKLVEQKVEQTKMS
ncbi:hypothetical protein C7B65_10585 [Phormidesmis priestleyi ULC007]|uniref:Uncharacterized protein n=1 Tax=Phormidesmis priestleyi ULC007 TaxID=1920490 RepID=A0A2T1DGU8_9CYAN|nr:hypothetical protein [Phormidesmis priestleyi]PSB19730.1 hypothetical protein C7B65_10585 [Phormidesmis priestleyi ULC007]PZO53614.1 MAG: hypothetical protein DCF14_04290 [Phormidesmis priestleyi]